MDLFALQTPYIYPEPDSFIDEKKELEKKIWGKLSYVTESIEIEALLNSLKILKEL